MRVALASQGLMGAGLLHALAESRHEVVALVANGRRMGPVARRLMPPLEAVFGAHTNALGAAWKEGLPILWLTDRDEVDAEALGAVRPDLLLSGDFGLIFKDRVLGVPSVGAVNMHWSLLPDYRGPNPSSRVILGGESHTGLTFHVTTRRIDAGAIIDQTAFPLAPDCTPRTIYVDACRLGRERVVEVLDRIERDGLVGREQDVSLGRYHKRLRADEVEIDWRRSAEEIDRVVRASGVPMAWFQFGDQVIYVSHTAWSPEEVSEAPGTVLSRRPFRVATGKGTITVLFAMRRWWFPLRWPAVWDRVTPGTVLAGE